MANIELDGTNKKIKVDSGDLTLDVPGDIILDADGADLTFADGGTNILKITNSSSDVVFQNQVDAKDIIFKQYDGTEVAKIDDDGSFKVANSTLSISQSSSDVIIKPLTDAKDIFFQQYDGRTLLDINDGGYVAIANGATGPGQLRLYEDTDNGTNYTALQVGTQSGDITYTLPTADGSSGNALLTNGSGTLSWGSAGAATLNALTDVSMDITNFVDGLLIQTDTDGSAPGTGTLSSATGNIGIGKDVFAALTDGTYNTAIGYQAADALTGGDDNIMIGKEAGGATTTGNDNVYIGLDAGKTLTSASQNIAIGSYAMDGATDLVCPNNTAIGYYAMSGALANGATENVAVGNSAFEDLTDAKYSTAIGSDAGKNVTAGFGNTCIGRSAGSQTTTGDYNTYLGYGSGATASDTTRAIAIGQDVRADSNDFSFGKTSNVVTNDFDADANWSRSSDVRLKKNITDQKLGLDFINDLRTVKYNWKPSTELDEKDASLNHLRVDKDSNPVDHKDFDGTVVNNMNTTATMHNFIAQEVKAALDKEGVSDFGGWKEDQYGVQQVSREMFIIPLVKAVQELSAKVKTLEDA